MKPNVNPFGISLGEVFAGQHLGHALPRSEPDDVHQAHFPEPLTVVAHFQMSGIGQQNFPHLGHVSFCIRVDFLARQELAGFISTRGIADARGVIADDENRLVAPILKLPNDSQRNCVAQRHVRRGRIHPQLDSQRLARLCAAL